MDTLNDLRTCIDAIDARIIHLLGVRGNLSRRVGEVKRRQGIPYKQAEVEIKKIETLKKLSVQHGINPVFIAKLWKDIMSWSLQIQGEEGEKQSPRGSWG